MAILKCKMCGGNLEVTEGVSVVECEYCGTNQTVPNVDDDKKMNLFARANRLRFACEFDKAAGIYESILADFPEEAEGYWGLVLCKYGIEYVDDPATAKKVPTCHRSSFESIMDDSDYEQALENADAVARSVYRNEAKQIEEIRKGIIEVSSKEEPYDIFICYKETAEDGQRTIDSVLAQDVYDVLTDKGYRTFFARITLEDKLGQEYEPYIFAALNSAKVMLAFGTDYEYFNAVWVKNEWSRYLKLMEKDKGKHLIPCYKGIDAYDIPKEFVRLQAQDLGKVGAVQDLVRGIEKLILGEKSSENVQPQQMVVRQTGPDCESLLKRAFMFLEDGEWRSADEYCEKVLDIDPENARAYLGKLMAELNVKNRSDLKEQENSFEDFNNYKKVLLFADETLKEEMTDCILMIKKRKADFKEQKLRERILAEEEKYRKIVIRNIGSIEGDIKKIQEEINDLIQEETQVRSELKLEQEMLEKREQSFEVDRAIEEEQAREQCEKQKKVIFAKEEEIKEKETEINGLNLQIQKLSVLKFSLKKELNQKVEILQKHIFEMKADLEKEKKKLPEIENLKKIKIQALKTALKKQKEIVNILKKIVPKLSLERMGKEQELKQKNEKLLKLKAELENVTKVVECKEKNRMDNVNKIEAAKVGESIFFGLYQQKADLSREEEAIEWLVLDKKNNKVLLLSKYGLDCKKYDEIGKNPTTWETCTLRKWLNNEFLNTAFSEMEKSLISKVLVSADENPKEDTYPGNATEDQVFMLSIKEAEMYFTNNTARQCKPTAYAVAKEAHVDGDNGNCWWWTRTPGLNHIKAAVVETDGSEGLLGSGICNANTAVRPALWVDLNS